MSIWVLGRVDISLFISMLGGIVSPLKGGLSLSLAPVPACLDWSHVMPKHSKKEDLGWVNEQKDK